MKNLKLHEIRSEFLEFFKGKEHLALESFSLIPKGDKSLLLIGAGMAPMKKYFTKELTPPHSRVTTCQKCIRTGDIDNVGKTDRHATFFEMLGNFSFGDYFKNEAIEWAWEFLTERLEIEKEKLWVTVYYEDDEAFEIWRDKIGVPEDRIVRLGKEDNFWELEVGPSGPCSEIYIDRGEEYGIEGEDKPGGEGDRFIEVWNLVFTQFDKDEEGIYHPLSHPNIDTGMGLERISTVLQNTNNIFEIDAIKNIILAISKMADIEYGKNNKLDESIRVITDHIRAMTFMISDSIRPSNEGRGYVLRRLIRRAAKHGKNLGINGSFLYELTDEVISSWGKHYTDLTENRNEIKKVIKNEEERFAQTIDKGSLLLEDKLKLLKENNKETLSGEDAFKLYDTYGFPIDLTEEIIKENGFKLDKEEFFKLMEEQRNRARSARDDSNEMGWSSSESEEIYDSLESKFVGYDLNECETNLTHIFTDNQEVFELEEGKKGFVVLDETPFYGQSGGQIGDTGYINSDGFTLKVLDTKKTKKGLNVHLVKVEEGLCKPSKCKASIDVGRRNDIRKNHSVTHLLHKALKDVLGDHVNQAGSEVGPERMRFDFTHFEAIKLEDLQKIENEVNEKIFESLDVNTTITSPKGAYEMGAVGLFEEKYSDEVRVLSMGDYSMELCGGTHVNNTSDINMFKILSESGISSGVRRIEGITGKSVYSYLNSLELLRNESAELLKTTKTDIISKINTLTTTIKDYEKEIDELKLKSAKDSLSDIINSLKIKNSIAYITYSFDDVDVNTLRNIADEVREKVGSVIVLFSTITDNKLNFVCAVSKDLVSKGYSAGNIVKEVAKIAQGGGGGRPDMATAGAKDLTKVNEALKKIEELI